MPSHLERSRNLVAGASALFVVLLVAAQPAAADPQIVTFDTSDGQKITADYYAPRGGKEDAPICILLHMYSQNRSTWKPLVPALRQAGFAVLAIDLRGHGDSATHATKERMEQKDTRLFADMDKDVWAAYDWLAQQKGVDRARFAVVGASVGCSVALRYAALDRSVDAVVCMSPGENYLGIDSRLDIKEVTGRKMFLTACENEKSACDVLKKLADGDRLSGGEKASGGERGGNAVRVKIYEGAAHGTNMLGTVPGVENEIVTFLLEAVGRPATSIVFGSIKSDDKIYHAAGSGWIDRIKPTNMRYWSSAQEAESRGLRASKSKGPEDKPGEKNGKSDTDQNKSGKSKSGAEGRTPRKKP